ncbi:ribulose bisphosphate carboxylase small subunit [Rufibacter quisquiliarum]|uniref:Ribulose bisphosphate carboxylase small subunit n=1 Tax=Rufibacter quisquiliarum TaxID=1549639 RepID=A0A839GQH2_9BACT|nr:ribulose bisphosphate carboxylase small subunit [Rufibacter quisquiliarum]
MEQRVITVLSRLGCPGPDNNHVTSNDTAHQVTHLLGHGFRIQSVSTQISPGIEEGSRQDSILSTTYLLIRED